MSEIGSIQNLQAAINAYNNVSTRNIPATPKEAVQFQEMVNVQFNRYAGMTPSQILDHISASRSAARSNIQDSVNISSSFEGMGNVLRKSEDTIKKSVVGEASLQEVMIAANEAGNAVKMATALRNKFFESLDKIMNMQL